MNITSTLPAVRTAGQQPPTVPTQSSVNSQANEPKESFVPAAAAGVVGLGAGYLGAQVGAAAGFQLGLLLTPPSAPLGDLLANMVMGGRIGLVAGAVSFGVVGGAAAYMGAKALMGSD